MHEQLCALHQDSPNLTQLRIVCSWSANSLPQRGLFCPKQNIPRKEGVRLMSEQPSSEQASGEDDS